MSSAAQILANQANAQRSTGPATAEGKARVSQNATEAHRQPLGLPLCAAPKTFGLFSATGFVRADERDIFEDFSRGYTAELSPETPLEQTLATEIIHAAWRLRRCADLECAPPEATDEDLDRLQASIDRARATAQRTLHRALAELRRVRREAHSRPPGEALMNELHERYRRIIAAGPPDSAKQSQPEPPRAACIPRSAPCPCGSREKYKRCCGKNAPPVLSARSAHLPRMTSARLTSARFTSDGLA